MMKIALVLSLCVGACAVGDNITPEPDDTAAALALVSASPGSETRELSMFEVVPSDSAHPGAAFTGTSWHQNGTGFYMYYPINTFPGDHITGYSWVAHKVTSAGTATANIAEIDLNSGTILTLPGSIANGSTVGTLSMGTNALDYIALAGKTYVLRVAQSGSTASDWFSDAQAFVLPIL